MGKFFGKLLLFVKKIGRYFGNFGKAVFHGDIFVKLSLLIMGASCFRRKQFIRGLLITAFQAVFIVFMIKIGIPNISKFATLGTVQAGYTFDNDFNKIWNNYDHSLRILLFSVVTIVYCFAFLIIYINNIVSAYKTQKLAAQGGHVNSFKDDFNVMRNGKFYITLLFFPCLGVILFTLIPMVVMFLVSFTNYDSQHPVPTYLFTWVGFDNFKKFLSMTGGSSFGYAFVKIIVWTLVWAFLATFTTYIGGILLSMFINNKKTKLPKMWRTIFIITIAVPQFVSLLLVRYFFQNTGIVNTICSNIGLTDLLKQVGLVSPSLSYIPFLSDPGWCKFMIIIINIWIGVPYLMLIATGVLMNIPEDMYESARIDGASRFQMFRKITMPYMLFVTGPYLVTSFIQNINNFNVIYLLTQDVYVTLDQKMANVRAQETDLLVTWLFRLTQEEQNYKIASVIGVFVFLICAVFTLIAFTRLTKGDREDKFQI